MAGGHSRGGEFLGKEREEQEVDWDWDGVGLVAAV